MSIEEVGTETHDAANLAWAGDRERLLPYEPLLPVDREDTRHWVAVYEDLVAFNRRMIDLVETRLQSDGIADDRHESPDLALLRAHLERLSFRLDHWKRQGSEIAPDGAGSENGQPGHIS